MLLINTLDGIYTITTALCSQYEHLLSEETARLSAHDLSAHLIDIREHQSLLSQCLTALETESLKYDENSVENYHIRSLILHINNEYHITEEVENGTN